MQYTSSHFESELSLDNILPAKYYVDNDKATLRAAKKTGQSSVDMTFKFSSSDVCTLGGSMTGLTILYDGSMIDESSPVSALLSLKTSRQGRPRTQGVDVDNWGKRNQTQSGRLRTLEFELDTPVSLVEKSSNVCTITFKFKEPAAFDVLGVHVNYTIEDVYCVINDSQLTEDSIGMQVLVDASKGPLKITLPSITCSTPATLSIKVHKSADHEITLSPASGNILTNCTDLRVPDITFASVKDRTVKFMSQDVNGQCGWYMVEVNV